MRARWNFASTSVKVASIARRELRKPLGRSICLASLAGPSRLGRRPRLTYFAW